MRKPPAPTFQDARRAFLKALASYQTATRDKNVAIQRVFNHTQDIYESLSCVVKTSESMIAPRRLDR